ncbi:MAG TPA: fibronectin type III domain-containing protein [Solirubrobacteraceae bacterium]|jgi:hypothetical protein
MRLRIPILFTTLLAALAAPVAAQGAQQQFYAAPSGSGSACSQAAPCSLATAMESAKDFDQDELTLASGSYGSLEHPLAPPPQNEGFNLVHGTPGAPAPQLFIDTTGAGPPNTDVFALQLNGGATLRDVAITALGSNDEGVEAGSLDHVLVTDTTGEIACQPLGNIRDSACVALAGGAHALNYGGSYFPATPHSVEYDNDTFYAPGGTAAYLWPVNFALTVKTTDTIFDGATFDIDGSGGGGEGGTLDVVPSYDAFGKVKPVNLIPPPKGSSSYHIDAIAPTFADPATGDVHESSGSSTIDVGTEENAGGVSDLGGGPRWIGHAMDIGAYEAPTVPIVAQTLAGHDGVSVLVNPDGAETTVTLRYGSTPAYGSTATVDAGSGSASVAELLPVSGFAPDATYYYEVTATNAIGTAKSSPDSFSASLERFASPAGSSSAPCTLSAPCDLLTAVNGASSDDEVLLAPGSYGSAASPLTTPLVNSNSIVIDGSGSGSAPQIFLSTPSHFDLELNYFSRVAGIELFATGASDEGALITGVIDHDLIVAEHGLVACESFDGTVVADTACLAPKTGAKAFFSVVSTSTSQTEALGFDHDTFLAGGASATALSIGAYGFPLQATATDSIFDGSTGIAASSGTGPSAATLLADHSDYATVEPALEGSITAPGTATNITAAPLFLDAAGDDVHEAPGSPTIDAGAADPFGSLTDLAGAPRTIGPATDIGAYEALEAPTIGDASTDAVTASTLTVLADVNPNFADTEVHVDYGTSTAYGASTTPIDVGAGLAAVPISIPLTGLAPDTTYHLRVVAINAAGTSDSSDLTLTTSPTVDVIGAIARGAPAPGTLTASPTAIVKGSSAAVLLTCAAPASAPSLGCHGTLRLTIKQKRRLHKGRRTVTKTIAVTIGSASFALAGTQRKMVAVHLTATILASLKATKHHRLPVTLQVLRSDGAAKSGGPLTLVLAPAKAKHKHKHKQR